MLIALILGLQFLASLILMSLSISAAWERRKNSIITLHNFLLMISFYSLWSASTAIHRLIGIIFHLVDWPGALAGTAGTITGWTVLNFILKFPESDAGQGKRLFLNSTLALTVCMALLPWFPGFIDNRRLEGSIITGDRGWSFFLVGGWVFFLTFIGYVNLLLRYREEKRQPQRFHLLCLIWGFTPAILLAFVFTYLLPIISGDFQKFAWLGPSATIIVTAVIFFGISQSALYDIQTTFHRIILLLFITSMGVGVVYIPIGYVLSMLSLMDLRTGIILFIALIFSHTILAYYFPRISSFMVGAKGNPEDLVRQVLSLAADVDRDVHEICRDVAILLKLSLHASKIVAAIPMGDKYRIMPAEENELTTKEHVHLLKQINANVRVTRALSRFINETAPDLSLRILDPGAFGQRRRRRVLAFAEEIRYELMVMGFEVLMPVMRGGQPLAIFFIGKKNNNSPFFQSEHLTLRTISSALSIALKNADQYGMIARVNNALLKESGSVLDVEPIQRVVTVNEDRQIVYRGRTMEETLREIEKAAKHDESVLVLGETGSGKDLAVHLIHSLSSRSDRPLIAINCAALADSLLENELFGHEKGAYTGADRTFPGLFEQAEGGVLFLDEIGEISEALQLKLLRVLEDRKVRRLGGKAVRVNIRIVTATNKDLKDRVEKGLFRADLYYRLNVISIRLPPLRERREDVPVLVEHFIHRYAARFARTRLRVSPEAMRLLQQHDWPGNVRELENTVLRAFVNAQGDALTTADFPEITGQSSLPSLAGPSGPQRRSSEPLEDFLKRMEGLLIQDALIRSGGNKARAAKDLGLSRTTFYHKLGSIQKSS